MTAEAVDMGDGYRYGVVKVDRRIDGYLASVDTPLQHNYSGLFPTKGRAVSWCRHIIARDRKQPLGPNGG